MLPVNIQGVHFDVSRNVCDYIQERFASLDTYLDEAKSVSVTVTREPDGIKVLSELKNGHLPPVYAQAVEKSVYGAIRRSSELVRKQLRRMHSRLVKQHA